MVKTDVYSIAGTKKGQVDLPSQFSEPVRADLIKRAVLAQQSHSYQRYGADPRAGTKQGNATPKRRHKYRTTYGPGISRIKRKFSWRRGLRFGFIGAFVASAVSGRKAFPPRANKILAEQINVRERRKAIRSAIAATAVKDLIVVRNHQISNLKSLPLIVEDKLESLNKAKAVTGALVKLGLNAELARSSKRKVRAGKGKMRGRRHKTKVGPLIVVGNKCDVIRAARNIPGVDVMVVDSLNAELLAPGTVAGRLTVWTNSAIERLKGGLFV